VSNAIATSVSDIERSFLRLETIERVTLALLLVASVGGVLCQISTMPVDAAALAAAIGAVPLILVRERRAPVVRDALLRELHDRRKPLASRPAVIDVRQRVHDILDAAQTMEMVLQPIVRLSDGATVGHEALARFADGRAPDLWFREAAEAGLGVELELAAVEKAIAIAPRSGYLSVNVGPHTLASPELLQLLDERARATLLVLELTEHAVVGDYAAASEAVARVRAKGVRVAVDDAGSGVSSFQHVLRLRPDMVKLDRWIVDRLDEDPARQALVRFMVAFAAEVHIDLVAEGIERPEELENCEALGITLGQGYFFGRPGIVLE